MIKTAASQKGTPKNFLAIPLLLYVRNMKRPSFQNYTETGSRRHLHKPLEEKAMTIKGGSAIEERRRVKKRYAATALYVRGHIRNATDSPLMKGTSHAAKHKLGCFWGGKGGRGPWGKLVGSFDPNGPELVAQTMNEWNSSTPPRCSSAFYFHSGELLNRRGTQCWRV